VSRVVFDASAILAAINSETGSDAVLRHMHEAAISTVNLAEVFGKLVQRGVPESDAWHVSLSFCSEVVPFDAAQSKLAGSLISATQAAGLSLGDRACLALATLLQLPVYTTDRMWKKLRLGVDIRLIR
jgi:ribonuclease VapC